MTISDELNNLFKSKKDEQENPKYIMIRFGVSATNCTFELVNPDMPTTKIVLDSLEKISSLHISKNLSYKPIGIFYEITDQEQTEGKVESKSTK